jgi:hypothetical protein
MAIVMRGRLARRKVSHSQRRSHILNSEGRCLKISLRVRIGVYFHGVRYEGSNGKSEAIFRATSKTNFRSSSRRSSGQSAGYAVALSPPASMIANCSACAGVIVAAKDAILSSVTSRAPRFTVVGDGLPSEPAGGKLTRVSFPPALTFMPNRTYPRHQFEKVGESDSGGAAFRCREKRHLAPF